MNEDPTGYLVIRADILALSIDAIILLVPGMRSLNNVLKKYRYVPKHLVKKSMSTIRKFLIKVLPKVNIGLGFVGRILDWMNNLTGRFPFGVSVGGLIAWACTKAFKSWTGMAKMFVWRGPKVRVTYFSIF